MSPRKFLRLVPVFALLVCLRGIAQEDVIRVNVRLVRLLVTVKDAAGQQIGSLKKTDFDIYDNGVKQELGIFEHHTEQPLAVTMLVDSSASTAKELRYELDSVTRFLHALVREGNPDDSVKLYTFNWAVTEETKGFTRNIKNLEQKLKLVKPEGGTSMYDAIWFASRALEERDARHVIVIVTDGGDTTSGYKFKDAVEAAQRADAVVYPILVMPITNDAGRNIGGENALTTLAGWTGGRVFAPNLGPALDEAFSEILKDLRTQYMLGYYPKNLPYTKERFHTLQIKLSRKDLRVQARNGYYGDSEDSAKPVPATRGRKVR